MEHFYTGNIKAAANRIVELANSGLVNGPEDIENEEYWNLCKGFHYPTGTYLFLHRDLGDENSVWRKRPGYMNSYHLCLSFFDPDEPNRYTSHDHGLAKRWISEIFGLDNKNIWIEPTISVLEDEVRKQDDWYYRIFCDRNWNPIKVANRFTARHLFNNYWKLYSDFLDRMDERAAIAHKALYGD